MKRTLSVFVVILMMLFGGVAAFGDVPADVAGTPYEAAVLDLMDQGVIKGYPDGTYQPEAAISRGEACVVVVNSMMPPQRAPGDATASFSDMRGHWSSPYVAYAFEENVISGHTDGTFRPEAPVTYNEMAAMLVRALGFQASDLTGEWPDNFVDKAKSLGLFTGISFIGTDSVSRGNVARMTHVVLDDIRRANQPPEEEPETPSYADLAGPLAEYSGRAYGILLDTATVLDEEEDVVSQLEFLFGKEVLLLNTDGKFDVPTAGEIEDVWSRGEIYMLQMRSGMVRKILDSKTSRDSFEPGFDLLSAGMGLDFDAKDRRTGSLASDVNLLSVMYSHWEKVEDTGDGVVKVDRYISYLEDASIYVAEQESDGTITGYKAGSSRDIRVGSYVRMYSVTGDEPGVAEIVLVAPKRPRAMYT